MDRILVQIQVVVGRNRGENPLGLKGKGSWATTIDPGSVDPNRSLSMVIEKGKQVHIPVPRMPTGNERKRSDACR